MGSGESAGDGGECGDTQVRYALVVGETIIPARRLVFVTLAVVIGAILYRFFIALALNSEFIGLKAQDLNLVTAALVTLALVLPATRKKLFARKNGGA